MRNAYVQVAATYMQRWLFVVPLLFLLLIVCLVVFTREPVWLVVLFYAGAWGSCIGVHLKDHLARPEGTLTPRLKTAHLTVAGVIAAVAVTPIALLMIGQSHTAIAGTFAMIAAVFVADFALFYYFSSIALPFGFALPGIVMGFASFFPKHFTTDLLLGGAPLAACFLLFASGCGLVLLVDRILRLCEEFPEYRWRPLLSLKDLRAHRIQPTKLADIVNDFALRPLDSVAGHVNTSFLQRVRLIQLPQGLKGYPRLSALFICGLMLLAIWKGESNVVFTWLSGYSLGVPMMFVLMWLQGPSSLGAALLRPATRSEWAAQNIAALGMTLLLGWAMTSPALIGLAAIVPGWIHLTLMLQVVVLMGTVQCAMFGGFLWAALWLSRTMRFALFGAIGFLYVPAVLFFSLVASFRSQLRQWVFEPSTFTALNLILLFVGAGLIWQAHRRLCAMDLN